MSRLEQHKIKKHRKIGKFAFPLLLLFIVSGTVFWLTYPFPSDIKNTYFSTDNPIIFQNEKVNYDALLKDGKHYLPLDFVMEFVDKHIEYDEQSSSVIVTTKDKVYQMPTDKLTQLINQQETTLTFPVMIVEDESLYISTSWMEDIYPIKINYSNETGAILINKNGDSILKGSVVGKFNEDLFRLREKPALTSPYVATLKQNESVMIEEEKEHFYKVRKENGVAGFVKKEMVQIVGIETVEAISEVPSNSINLPKLDWPIHLTWDAIYNQSATPSSIANYEGVQVISPTWFHLDGENGTIRSYATKEYIQAAHEQEYQVWALFSNDFDAERTHHALKTYETRQNIITQLLHYARIYDLDGFNVDFENVMLEDGELLTQFMREFTPLAHEAGLIVSMDITFISTNERYSKFYEREELREVADYLMVMAYDEHWASSPKSGSVASLPWVETNLKRLLEVIPHDRLLLGVPLYTRLWTETIEEDGSVTVDSESMSMEEVEMWINDHNVTPVYDEESGQEYVEWKDSDNNVTYKIWIENELSLQKRTELVHKYRLAGIASWSDYFASETIWKQINQSLRIKSVVGAPEEAKR